MEKEDEHELQVKRLNKLSQQLTVAWESNNRALEQKDATFVLLHFAR